MTHRETETQRYRQTEGGIKIKEERKDRKRHTERQLER